MDKKSNKKTLLVYASKVFSWFILTLLILVAGFLVYYVVSANIYAKKGTEFRPKFAMYTIISPSMVPNIKVYDVIFNTRVDDVSTLKEGDVITFISTSIISEGMTVTHRIVGIVETSEGLKFRTKGDNNLTPDSALVDANNVLGKVLFKIPQLGRVQFLLASKGGWIFLILVPALLVIVCDVVKIFKLVDVKKKVTKSILDNEEKIDPEQIKREEERKQELKDKLFSDNNVAINKAVELPTIKSNKQEANNTPKKRTINTEKKSSNSKKKNSSKKKTGNSPKVKTPQVIKVDIELPKKK